MLLSRSWGPLAVLLALAFFLSPATLVSAAPQRQEPSAVLEIINQSNQSVCSIYISAGSESGWGDNYLAGDSLAPDASVDIALLPGTYDVLLLSCRGEKLHSENRIKLNLRYTLMLSERDVQTQECNNIRQTGIEAYNLSHYGDAQASLQDALRCFQAIGERAGEGATLNSIALVYDHQGRYKEALETYKQALETAREVGDPASEGRTLNNIAVVYYKQGRYQEASELLEQALAIARDVGDRAGEGIALSSIALLFEKLGKYQDALDRLEQALTIAREVGDRAGEGRTLNNIAQVYYSQGRYPEALAACEQALAIRREVGDRYGEGRTLINIGRVYDGQGRYPEALAAYEQAQKIADEVGDRAAESGALNNIAHVYDRQGRYPEALASFKQALAIVRELGDRADEGTALNNIAAVYGAQGRYEEALDIFEQALTIARDMGDRAGEGRTLNNIAHVYGAQGRYEEALDIFEQALAIVREIGDRASEGNTLNNIAVVYTKQGKYAAALNTYEQALALRREVGDRYGEGRTLNNIAQVYDDQGRYQKAMDTYKQALDILRDVGDRAAEGTTLNAIGGVYAVHQRYKEALDTYKQALDVRHEVGDHAGEGITLNNMATVYDEQGRYEEALGTYEQALTIAIKVGDRDSEGRTLNNIAFTYTKQEKYQEAMGTLEQALAILRDVGDRAEEGKILRNMAAVYDKQGRYQEALDTFAQAADVLESVRAVAGSDQARASFTDQYTSVYDGLLQAAFQLHQPETAFLASERGRARAFLDSLATGEVQLEDVRNADLLADEQEAYAVRQAAQDALATAHGLTPSDPDVVTQRETELQEADQTLEQVRSKIAAQGEQLAALVPGRSTVLTLPQVQALLDKDTTLVSFWMLENKTLAFVITAHDFTVVELPDATPEAVRDAVDSLYQWSSRENPFPRPLRNLYTWIIDPLASHLTTAHVAIIPHQQLHYVPFTALTDGKQYFGQQHILSLLPSATSLQFLQQNAQVAQQEGWKKVLVLGNPATDLPPLPASEDEAQSIGELFHTDVYTGTQASEARLWQKAEGSAIIHLAAHGSYNEANPLYSAISLAEGDKYDGKLETSEIYALPLKGTELVTLSACETSMGALSRGDEVVGLTRAVFFAGAPSVLSSLWQVDDAATGALMTAFYRNWQQKGMDKAAALQAAQAEVAANPNWRSPFFWAGFNLNGDIGYADK